MRPPPARKPAPPAGKTSSPAIAPRIRLPASEPLVQREPANCLASVPKSIACVTKMPGAKSEGLATGVESPWGLMRSLYAPHMVGANKEIVAKRLISSFRMLNAKQLDPLGSKWASSINGNWVLRLPSIEVAQQQVPEFQKTVLLKRIAALKAQLQKEINAGRHEANFLAQIFLPGSVTIRFLDSMKEWIDQGYDRSSATEGLLAAARGFAAGLIIFFVLQLTVSADTILGIVTLFRGYFLGQSPTGAKQKAILKQLQQVENRLRAERAKIRKR